ncbi:MAG: hypothetical protein LC101_09685 [Flavobacteriales bacterium]|nr:hypothetical protein [Chitinophagales bacterium]MCZ2444030.1 hypothetical protein [Flavobacteriales bacterium]
MKTKFFFPILIAFTAALTSCSVDNGRGAEELGLAYDFSKSYQGWTFDIADYNSNQEQEIEFACKYTRLPQPLNTEKSALLLAANNVGGQLFFYIKRPVTDLIPNTKYAISFQLELASNASSNAGSNNISPKDVFVKVGATTFEPQKEQNGSFYHLNIDKGNGKQDGMDMKMIGDVDNGSNQSNFSTFFRSNLNKSIEAETDENGNMWLIIGFDSSFPARSIIYVSNIKISLNAI